jgi:hypothetical protein
LPAAPAQQVVADLLGQPALRAPYFAVQVVAFEIADDLVRRADVDESGFISNPPVQGA